MSRAVALHEAAHALCALELGLEVRSVSIDTIGGAGHVEVAKPDGSEPTLEQAFTILCAGTIGEQFA